MKGMTVWWTVIAMVGWGLWGLRVYGSSQLKEISWELADEAYEAVGLAQEYKEAYEECIRELGR